MEVALPSGETVPSHDFFARARARLALDVPAALNDPDAPAARGDLDLDPSLWERAGVSRDPAGGGAGSGGRPSRADGAAHAAHRAAEPSRADRVPGRQDRSGRRDARRRRRCARPRRRSGSPRELIEPIGYLDLYLTVLRLPHPADGGARRPGLSARAQRARGRGRLRGAARLPDGCRRTTRCTAATGRASSAATTPCRSASATSGASPRGSCGTCTSGSTSRPRAGRRATRLAGFGSRSPVGHESAYDHAAMIRPVLTELALFLAPFVVYAVFLWATRARRARPGATGRSRASPGC